MLNPAATAGRAPGFGPMSQPQIKTEPGADRLSVIVLWIPILGITIFSKLAVTLGTSEILIGVPAILGATALGLATRRLSVEPVRLFMFLVVASIMVAESAFAVKSFSLPALLLVIALIFPYSFQLNMLKGENATRQLERYVDLTYYIGIAGFIQYFAQFVIGAKFAYPIEHFLPSNLITHNYNYLNELSYGSTTYKANGIFLLEPSYFSQTLVFGFALEAARRKRPWRLFSYLACYTVSFSGTGIVLMSVVFPTLMIVYRRFSLLVLMVVGGFTIVTFGESLGLGVFLERSQEFESTQSSGYMRYVGPALVLGQYLWNDPKSWMFGVGSGMFQHMTPKPIYNAAETGWAKLILEFGLVGSFAYFLFLYTSIFRSPQPTVLKAALGMMTLLSGITDAPPHSHIIPLLIWLHLDQPWEQVTKAPSAPTPPAAPPRPAPARGTHIEPSWARR